MNVNSGGPHLLLFERDQQLTALLTSELQLAGYECHAARTAVEVFDAIARYPIRLVLVNLAQAAAGRREFWVALDAQRRGRGVQVFTFRCMNLAGYGPDDPDERSRNVMADMEVDGMLGIMNLVNAVRARIPGSTTGSNPRIPATPVASRQAGNRDATSAGARESNDVPQASPRHTTASPAQAGAVLPVTITGQATSPLPTLMNNGTSTPSSQSVPSPALQHSQPSASGSPIPQTGLSTSSMPAASTVTPSTPPVPAEPGNTPSGLTDKIRAVIYPSNRNFSPGTTGQEASGNSAWGTSKSALPGEPHGQSLQNRSSTNSSMESGLEQLSRMVREQALMTQEQEMHQEQQIQSLTVQGTPSEESSPGERQVQRVPSAGQITIDPSPISAISLRASPIQDIAIERGVSGSASGGTSRQIVSQQVTPPREALGTTSPNPSIPPGTSSHPAAYVPPSTPALPPTPPPPTPKSELASLSMSSPVRQPTSISTSIRPENEEIVEVLPADAQNGKPSSSFIEGKPGNGVAPSMAPTEEPSVSARSLLPAETESRHDSSPSIDRGGVAGRLQETPDQPEKSTGARTLVEQVQATMQGVIRRNELGTSVSTDETLLNIVQSFPPMPSPSPSTQQAQPPVLSGRATRSLGSVLLEGHLVPQHRLEVAQQIQRMLRGVDMNYQLGEILLMFKLLTPDQLLAASLVSYGLISTMQISALGRIRQELHSIGLEYDLESLLVLFRILTPEQLREVRASWSG